MAGGDMPAGQLTLGHPPCQHGRAVAGGVISAAGHQLPGCALGAVLVAVLFQELHSRSRGVEGADTGVQEIEETFDGKGVILHFMFSFIFRLSAAKPLRHCFAMPLVRVAAPNIHFVQSIALVPCWPLPQQQLPSSATGGGCCCCLIGEAGAFLGSPVRGAVAADD